MAAYADLTGAQQKALRIKIIRILKEKGTSDEENNETHDALNKAVRDAEA